MGIEPFTLASDGSVEYSTDGTTYSTTPVEITGGETVYLRAAGSDCLACGMSAYEIWLANGNTGTEADFLASLVGEPGPPGDGSTISGIQWQGSWTATPTSPYVVNDAVQYNGTSYVKTGTGGDATLPPNDVANLNVSWEVLALKGLQGDPGNDGANGASGVAAFRTLSSTVNTWTLKADAAVGTATPGGTESTTNTTDAGVFITTSTSSTFELTLPANLTNFPVGFQVSIMQLGTGQVQIKPDTTSSPNSTIVSANSMRYLRTQYSAATMVKKSATEWYLFGDLTNVIIPPTP